MWFFIMAELGVFGIFFAVYAWFRHRQPALFAQGQAHVDLALATANTALLILGSAAAAWAAHTMRDMQSGAIKQARLALSGAWLCGMAFVILKLADFTHKIQAGYTMATDDFWQFYFSLTFFHFLHVILGMVILAMVWFKLRPVRLAQAEHISWVETGAAYWHMVDIVWLVLFALVYVAR